MTGGDAGSTTRAHVETTVRERARHATSDKVGDTRSFANMEQTLTREYWGRFLIELLQNARDAWLASSPGRRDGLLRIRLTRDRALVVCNEGSPLTPSIVLDAISKFGESPKKPGEGIGHKGIGFKAVLELTHSPRLYSRADAGTGFDLSVRFDPDEARRLVMNESPDWERLVAALASAAADDGRGDRIPILRFPLWDDAPPEWLDDVAAIDGRGFNTVIGLPYDSRFDEKLEMDGDEFVARVRQAFTDVTDEVVLLLGVFGRIIVEDQLAGTAVEITRAERRLPTALDDTSVHEVVVLRDGLVSSRWWLFERSLPGLNGLLGDLGVAVRLQEDEAGRMIPVAPRDEQRDGSSADCFHLFFPTRIRTHLPFLLHAYFEVDAGRKGFAEDRVRENQVRLDGLRALVLDVTRHLVASRDALDLLPLAGLFAATSGVPDDVLARGFREALLNDLDTEPWVVAGSEAEVASPRDLLVDDRGDLPRLLPIGFPPAYVQRRTGRCYPLTSDPEGLAFLARRSAVARGNAGAGLDAATLADLLRPGESELWAADHDASFRAVLEILDVIKRDPGVTESIEALRSDPTAVFIPVVDGVDRRKLRAPGREPANPDDEEPGPVGAILARVSLTGESPLTPPKSLGLDFLADGLLDAESLAGVGAKLGIRPYLTEVIIDALARAGGALDEAETLPFAWRLLLRERGKYSIINVLRTATTFEPGRWFWSKADGNTSDAEREDVRRARALSMLQMPARDGSWRPATELAFGADWADWLDAHRSSLGASASWRAEAYRDLEVVAPGPAHLAASPADMAELLPLSEDDISWAGSDAAPDLPTDPAVRHLVLVHAFLLRVGVWEIPPIKGYVNYRYPRSETLPPWQHEPGWVRLRQAQDRSASGFAQYGHGRICVAEDFAFRWPLEASQVAVRALSRGASFYRGYRKAELFCPNCHHSKRYSSDGDTRLGSYLAWQLSEEAWVPTTVSGSPTVAAMPQDSWFEDERPDDAKMQQSWLRFLPIATPQLSSDLALLAGVRRLRDADAPRIRRLLDALRERFEAGEVDREGRSGSFASQTFIGLHWRLYEQLAVKDAAVGREVLDRVGVLSVLGRSLVYRPRAEVRQDDGSHTGFRRHFSGQLPFVVLTREQGTIADALGIERFRVDVERVRGGKERIVTEDVRAFVHERAPEFLALQVYHPIGAKPLQLDGHEFPLRTERLRRLEVVRVDDLVLRLHIPGTTLVREIGAGRSDDFYLDTTQSPVVLYMDLAGSRWEDRFRALAGPHLATLLENPAYAATFQLLLQAESEADVEAFLEERSISTEDVELVRSRMDAIAGVVRDEERRWWRAVLSVLGSAEPERLEGEAYRREISSRLQACAETSPVPDMHERLIRAGGDEGSRHDGSPDGPLAALEDHGVDLRQLHQLLIDSGDRGLTIQVAAQRLAEWRRAHGREVTAILATREIDPDAAKLMPDRWSIPAEVALRARPAPGDYLRDAVADLRAVHLYADPERLASTDASSYLAELAGVSESRLVSIWNGLFDEEERARLDRDRARAWRRVLVPVLVAARTHSGDAGHVIRAEQTVVEGLLPANPEDAGDVAEGLAAVLPASHDLADRLASRIRDDRSLSDPTTEDLRDDLGLFLELHHLDRVLTILRRGRRQVVDQVRKDLDDVRERGLTPTPFVAARPPEPRPPKEGVQRTVVRPRRPHDQRVRDRLGVKGERIALAAVLDRLLELPRETQNHRIDELVELLLSVVSGDIVDRMVGEARAAQAAMEEDDRLEFLVGFLHVAQESDDFGFDLLGYLSPFAGSAPKPLLLEVKNSANRRFIASTAEWRRAEEQGDRYAFFIVVRESGGDGAASLELIPDPGELLRLGQIARNEDSWAVAYDPISPEEASLLPS